ncbi:Nramp family divalent metal transporter [Boudabousia marimammalium]|uniref:Nramp family divalent metal transporter n=1 Tax=Boudabousia marimammalium TaxID=156892 RepID=UPI000AEAB045
MAMLFQYLSAELGIATNKSLPDILGEHMSGGPRIAYWIQAELVAIGTYLAEVIGGALARYLLFDIPLLLSGFITYAVLIGLLLIRDYSGAGRFGQTITFMLIIITIGFVLGLVYGDTDWIATARGLVLRSEGPELLVASMLGATVMPHAIYA